MPTIAQTKQYLVQSVLPIFSGAVANWIVIHLHFLAAFHITAASVAGELTQLGVFAIGAALSWLASHHVLKGTYAKPVPPK